MPGFLRGRRLYGKGEEEQESRWITDVLPKTRTISIISRLTAPTPEVDRLDEDECKEEEDKEVTIIVTDADEKNRD